MPYPTTDDLKAALSIPLTETKDDELLDGYLAAAIGFIEGPAGAGRVFQVDADTTRYFDALRDTDRDGNLRRLDYWEMPAAGGGRTLFLDEDLCQITEVRNGDNQVVLPSWYITEPRNDAPFDAILLKQSAPTIWTYTDSPENAISVTGRWGYSVVPPAGIVQACRRLAIWLYRQKDTNADTDRPLVTGDGVTVMPSAIPADVKAVVYSYRRLI